MSTTTFEPVTHDDEVSLDGEGSSLYQRLAATIQQSVELGIFRVGDKIPSVRHASRQHRLSITTVLRAYVLLESRGIIESRPQSGYFVRPRLTAPTVRTRAQGLSVPGEGTDIAHLMLTTVHAIQRDNATPLGSPYPDPATLPCQRIALYANARARRSTQEILLDGPPSGDPTFIRQLARRYVENGQQVCPDEFVVTIGATEAIRLCLQAVARPGDAIAVESPCYPGMLEAIRQLGMRAVEVPCDDSGSIDLGRLAVALAVQKISACLLTANFQNPQGSQMPDEKKRELVEFVTSRGIPIIENDEYSELHFGPHHPTSLKTFDTRGLVLHCASFSRCLTHRHRIGWALPGRFRQEVEKLKFASTMTTPASAQLAMAEYLSHDGYNHHLRRLRKSCVQNASIMGAAVQRFFPDGTSFTLPSGGYQMWIEMPQQLDTLTLYREALASGVTIAPGCMFSTKGTFNHHLRLNFSGEWTPEKEGAIRTLGQLAKAIIASA